MDILWGRKTVLPFPERRILPRQGNILDRKGRDKVGAENRIPPFKKRERMGKNRLHDRKKRKEGIQKPPVKKEGLLL